MTHLTHERLAEIKAWKYRLLEVGEPVEPADEYFDIDTLKWKPVGSPRHHVTECHAPVRRLCTDLPAAVEEIKSLREFRQLAVDALNELQSLRKQIIHGGEWTKKVDALFERARKAGL